MGACLVNSAKEIVGTGCDKMPNGFKGNVQQRERYMHGMWLYSKSLLQYYYPVTPVCVM